MVKNGITRAYGTNLRKAIVKSAGNRFIACLGGALVTVVLQSSTATSLIIISFVKSGFITATVALAAIIGADIATTLVAELLTFDLSWLSPVLLAVGIITYNIYERSGRERHVARATIGIGLIILSLGLIREIIEPLKASQELPMILAPLNHEPMLAIIVGMILTWALHSSLATILLFAAFSAHHLISLDLALYLVLGANMGGALVPFAATRKEGRKVRQITGSNIAMRGITLVLVLPLLPVIAGYLRLFEPHAGRQLVHFHMGFNLLLGALFLPLVGVLAKTAEKLHPDISAQADGSHPQYLDEKALKTPVIALACAARETLRMSELVEKMLDQAMTAFEKNDDRLIHAIREQDNQVDTLNQAIKLYLTRLSQESFDPKEADRYLQILTFATNLEYVGDVIDKSLLELAAKKMRKQESFSEKGFDEIKDIHRKVLENLRLAQNIFLSEDPALAAELVENKKIVRDAESETSRQHFQRLHERKAESIATSSLHLDIVRDLRRINSYITSVAYTILNNHEKHKKKRKAKKTDSLSVPTKTP